MFIKKIEMDKNLEIQAIKVASSMIIDRGYNIEYIDNNYELNEPYVIKAIQENKILICFIHTDKLNIQGIKDKYAYMKNNGATNCIIIYNSSITSSAKKSIDIVDHHFELFSINELQLNITRHRLVPKHEKVTDEEKEYLEQNFKGKLPILLVSDAVSKYYSFQKGDYIKITRKNGSIIYRFVK